MNYFRKTIALNNGIWLMVVMNVCILVILMNM